MLLLADARGMHWHGRPAPERLHDMIHHAHESCSLPARPEFATITQYNSIIVDVHVHIVSVDLLYM